MWVITELQLNLKMGVQTVLEKKGIVFHLNAKVQSVDGATVIYEDAVTHEIHHLEGDAILLATGRRPNTSGLNLEVAGVKVNERGAIIVDEWLRTTNPAIRAIGDVKGGLQFTYISLDDYRIIREDLFGAGERRTDDREPVSYSVFMDPPLARVGLSEMEARKKGLNIKVNTLPVAAIPRARTLGETDGLFKVVVDADTNKILGCSLFGPETSEIINIVSIVMKTGQEYTFLRDYIFTHPSMSEALNDLIINIVLDAVFVLGIPLGHGACVGCNRDRSGHLCDYCGLLSVTLPHSNPALRAFPAECFPSGTDLLTWHGFCHQPGCHDDRADYDEQPAKALRCTVRLRRVNSDCLFRNCHESQPALLFRDYRPVTGQPADPEF